MLKNLQVFIYLFLVHLSVAYEVTYLMTAILPILYYVIFKPFDFSRRKTFSKTIVVLKISLLGILIILSVLSIIYKDVTLIYLPPIIISLLIAIPFALSLRKGYTPLITKIYFLTDGKDQSNRTCKRINYTKTLTWIWLIFISAILLEIILLSLFAPIAIWSLYVNIINYVMMLFLMVFEWIFRQLYFTQLQFKQWQSPLTFIKQMMLLDVSQLLVKEEASGDGG